MPVPTLVAEVPTLVSEGSDLRQASVQAGSNVSVLRVDPMCEAFEAGIEEATEWPQDRASDGSQRLGDRQSFSPRATTWIVVS